MTGKVYLASSRVPRRAGSGACRFSRLEQFLSSCLKFTRYTLQGRTSVCIAESYDLRKGRQWTGTSCICTARSEPSEYSYLPSIENLECARTHMHYATECKPGISIRVPSFQMEKLKLARLICHDSLVSGYWSDSMEPACPAPWPALLTLNSSSG